MATQIFQWDFNILNHTNIHSHNRGLLLLLIFFSLLIFITTFFLCVHWICAQYFPSTAAGATVHATPAPSPGLDPRTINSLPIILHAKCNDDEHDHNIEETECSICLGVFEDEEMVKILPQCNHAYHSRCVDKWLGSRSSCPLCRTCLTPITSA